MNTQNAPKVDPFEKIVNPVPGLGIEQMALIGFEVGYHYEKTGSLPVALRK